MLEFIKVSNEWVGQNFQAAQLPIGSPFFTNINKSLLESGFNGVLIIVMFYYSYKKYGDCPNLVF